MFFGSVGGDWDRTTAVNATTKIMSAWNVLLIPVSFIAQFGWSVSCKSYAIAAFAAILFLNSSACELNNSACEKIRTERERSLSSRGSGRVFVPQLLNFHNETLAYAICKGPCRN